MAPGPLIVASNDEGGRLPMGLAAGTDYWAIVHGPDELQLATSPHNAVNRIAAVIRTPGTGYHYILHKSES